MDIKDIYEVWDRFEKSSLSELKLSLGGDNLNYYRCLVTLSIGSLVNLNPKLL